MPAYVEKQGNKFRVVDASGILKNAAGTAVDGGDHARKSQAAAQARAINANQAREKRK